MEEFLGLEQRRELARRGFSRRDFGRLAALLAAGARYLSITKPHWLRGCPPFPTCRPTRSGSMPTRTH